MRLIDADKINFKGVEPLLVDHFCYIPLIHANAVVRTAPTINQWISVEERLPELPEAEYCYEDVLVAVKGWKRAVEMRYERTVIRGKRVERWKYWDRIFNLRITHWMPLPEAPKEE